MKKMKHQICTSKECKDVQLSVIDENTDPMQLVCENCGKEHKSLLRFGLAS